MDGLRALALLGILSVNIWFFAHPEMLLGVLGAAVETPADQLVRFGSAVIFEAKSYVVFSFLFGLSFVLAWRSGATIEKAEPFPGTAAERSLDAYETGVSETRRSVRRFAALIVLGLLHGLFLFAGDILLAYGILGFLLLGLRRISAKAALITAAVIYAVVAGFLLLIAGASYAFENMMEGSTDWLGDPGQAAALYGGTAGQWLSFHLGAYLLVLSSILLLQGPLAFAMFLLGLVVGRARLLERIAGGEFSTAKLLSLGLPALGIGALISFAGAWLVWGPPGSTGHSPGPGAELLGSALHLAAGPVQSFGYVVILLVIFRAAAPVAKLLAPAGRMSLTNYLTQSLIMVVLFAGVGLGLAGELSELAVGGIVLAIWGSQLLVSHLWFARFSRGPLEAPLRAWTYADR